MIVQAGLECDSQCVQRCLPRCPAVNHSRRVVDVIGEPVDLAVIGDEQVMADAVARYAEAGADELIFALTSLGSARDEERTWALLGELRKNGCG